MLCMNSLKLNMLEECSAVSVCRNSSVMPENNTAMKFGFKDTSFGVSFFGFFRFFVFCFYYFYYYAIYSKGSTAYLKSDMSFSA